VTAFELRPGPSPAQTANEELDWPLSARGTGGVDSQLTPWLDELGALPDAAIDLVRFATAAYLADERVPRPTSFTRSIELAVQVIDPAPWSDEVLSELADLLQTTTGDSWELSALAAAPEERPRREAPEPRPVARIALLSGGLDSLAGAAMTSSSNDIAYLGHWDIPTVKAAQDRVRRRFEAIPRTLDYVQLYHALRTGKAERDLGRGKVEHSQRTRAFLFMSLAVALATGRGANSVEVPENGFTSLNPPLGPERGGPLTTRSTHPMTISRFNALLRSMGVDVVVQNPYAWLTKGQLVAMAAPELSDFGAVAAETLSCAKLDGRVYLGGDPNKHCGLCYACIVRRSALLAAGLTDVTDYLSDTLVGTSRQKLIDRRAGDTEAVKILLETGIDETDILVLGPFPPEFDLDRDIVRAVELCRVALEEISLVPLP
jgi:queuosine biosynthesis protein QueC